MPTKADYVKKIEKILVEMQDEGYEDYFEDILDEWRYPLLETVFIDASVYADDGEIQVDIERGSETVELSELTKTQLVSFHKQLKEALTEAQNS